MEIITHIGMKAGALSATNSRKDLLQEDLLTHFCQWSCSIPHENIRKPIPPENFRKPLVFEISEDVPQGLEKKRMFERG